MNYSHRFIFFILILIIQHIEPCQEIQSIKEIAQHFNPKKRIMAILDIDNTLLHPDDTELGSDQWFSHHVRENVKTGMTSEDAVKAILPIYTHLNLFIKLVATEPALAQDLLHIKNNCEHVICLTKRSSPLIEKTIQELCNNSLYFGIPEHNDMQWELEHPCFYRKGCLFCGSNCKGAVLSSFLEKINYKPDLIICIDDKETYLLAVERVAQKLNIEYIGLRYAGCDKRVKKFDAAKAEIELQEFLARNPLSHKNSFN